MENNTSIEEMVQEMIKFLWTWGMWKNTSIFALGNAYDSEMDSHECTKCWKKDSPTVYIAENIDPEKYVYLPDGVDEPPLEHIFDMTFESALIELLDEGVLRTDYCLIQDEAWDYIFENSTYLEDWLMDYELYDGEKLLSAIINEDGEGSGYTMWDPLKYDDYTELEDKTFSGDLDIADDPGKTGEDLIPVYTLFDNYEEYQKFLNGDFSLLRKDNMLWQMTKRFAIKCITTEYIFEETSINGDIADHIIHDFNEIFRKHGMWYEPLYSWMIAGYRDP